MFAAATAATRSRAASAPPAATADAIAVIGLAGRYPQARDLDAFWRNLRDGRDCITEIPAERWNHGDFFDPQKGVAGKTYSKWGGFIEGVDEFDAAFFNIAPRDAERMDPQERLFLQASYQAIEDAGYARASLGAGRVGVFAGVMYSEYQLYGIEESAAGRPAALSGSAASIANRVSYHLDLHGPSMAVDTMCSSSLTALHLACRSLQRGECELALAGGVNVSVHPNKYLMLADNRFVSSAGRCESFGAGGDGYVPAEGVGVAVLKPLRAAIADGDAIHGVICATALNHGGKNNGYTVPNPAWQAAVIEAALGEAGVAPGDVSYVEAHGTGTTLGDPIEIAGLARAFGEPGARRGAPCAIGSVKSNIGHAESAAGIAGLTKVLLQMRHRMLVPSLHADTLNPNIAFETTPFCVQRALERWERPGDGERVAGVSSFGAGGANAHVIVREYRSDDERDGRDEPASTAPARARPAWIVLSARNEDGLRARAAQLRELAAGCEGDADLHAIAYTLQTGRDAMDERLAFEATSIADLIASLDAFARGEPGKKQLRGNGRARRGDAPPAGVADARLARGEHRAALDDWVRGASIDWRRAYGPGAPFGPAPRRMHLPVYPFARTRHWLPAPLDARRRAARAGGGLHPMLDANRSEFGRQRFVVEFDGREPWLADHRVDGRRVLPGVAYLEMARAALAASAPDMHADGGATLEDVRWLRPCIVPDGGATLEIALERDGDGIAFSISQTSAHAQPALCCTGRSPSRAARGGGERIDVDAMRDAFRAAPAFDADACYRAFARRGVQYGPSHRTIERVWADGDRALARLRSARPADPRLVMWPGLLDGALQSLIGLHGLDGDLLAAPYRLARLDVHGACGPAMWALARRAGDGALDLVLCDDAGEACVTMRGFASRAAASWRTAAQAAGAPHEAVAGGDARAAFGPAAESPSAATSTSAATSPAISTSAATPAAADGDDWLLLPRWLACDLDPERDAGARAVAPRSVLAIADDACVHDLSAAAFGGASVRRMPASDAADAARLAAILGDAPRLDALVFVAPGAHARSAQALIDAQESGAIALFRIVKALLAHG
ncbi:type I polyketide synthase, partial [Burkholderia thailandensis]|uniref:type I polyketide synthase n=2 Tax=Burkholderia thailandensis TaxID=57975 RepID=UPI0021557EC1